MLLLLAAHHGLMEWLRTRMGLCGETDDRGLEGWSLVPLDGPVCLTGSADAASSMYTDHHPYSLLFTKYFHILHALGMAGCLQAEVRKDSSQKESEGQ